MGFKVKQDAGEKLAVLWPQYSKKELDEFEVFLEKFKEDKIVNYLKKVEQKVLDPEGNEKLDEQGNPLIEFVRIKETKTVSIINLEEAMVEFGAMSKKKYMGRTVYSVIVPPPREPSLINPGYMPIKFELFNHKMKMLQNRNYAKKKELEGYEEMASEEIKVADLFGSDSIKSFPNE